MNQSKPLRLLGLSAKAGMLIYGSALSVEAAEAHKCVGLLTASNSSQNTKDRIARIGERTGIPFVTLPYLSSELAASTGRAGDIAAIAVTDRGMYEEIIEAIS